MRGLDGQKKYIHDGVKGNSFPEIPAFFNKTSNEELNALQQSLRIAQNCLFRKDERIKSLESRLEAANETNNELMAAGKQWVKLYHDMQADMLSFSERCKCLEKEKAELEWQLNESQNHLHSKGHGHSHNTSTKTALPRLSNLRTISYKPKVFGFLYSF